jgi:hypothetical protein
VFDFGDPGSDVRVLISGESPAPGVTTAAAGPADGSRGAWWKRPLFGVGIPLLVGLVHVVLVAPHYFVGSFDDDSNYILTARALLAGEGLTGHIASGAVVAGLYPPGYSALIAPLVWIWPHSFLPLRLLSVVCYGLVFVLTWMYLGRRRVGEGIRILTLGLLALGPPLATFGSMVMAEAPFLVAFLVLLILVDRWDLESKLWTGNGIGVVLLSGALVWLKEAGIGVVAGLVLWLLLKPQGPERVNRIKRALAVGLGLVALLLPVVVARLVAGIPLTGSRYSTELGAYYQGNFIHRILYVLPHSGWHLLVTAIPATLVPYLSPLPFAGSDSDVWQALSVLATLLILLGAVVWYRRHRDAALAIVPVYLLETVFWPEVNERRVILVLPVLAAWWAVGAGEVWRAIRAWSARRGLVPGARLTAAALLLAVVVVPLTAQMPRDYLFKLGQTSSQPQGSRYAAMLSNLGVPSDVVETDYLSTTALFTGHRTAWSAILPPTACNLAGLRYGIAVDNASFALLGDVNKPGVLDSPCLYAYVSKSPSAVRLLTTSRDNATVWELIGPDTGHPDLTDLTAGVEAAGSTSDGSHLIVWNWGGPKVVDQVSLGEARLSDGTTTGVELQLRRTDGAWTDVAKASAPVGDGEGAAPYLLAKFPNGQTATAMRLVLSGTGSLGPYDVQDAHALGQALSG